MSIFFLLSNSLSANTFEVCFHKLVAGESEAKDICQNLLDDPSADLNLKQKTQIYISLATFYNMETKTDYAHHLLDKVAIDNPLLEDANIFRYNWIRTRGSLYFEQEDFKSTLPYMLEGLEIANKMTEDRFIGTSANDVASTLMELGEYQQAMEYYQQALDAFTRLDKQYSIAISLAGIGIAHRDLGDYEAASNFLSRSIKASEAFVESNKDNLFAAINLNIAKQELALVFIELSDYQQAKPLLESTKTFFESVARFTDLVNSLTGLSRVELFEGNAKQALSLIERAINLELEHKLHSSLQAKRQLTLSLQANNQEERALESALKGLALSNEQQHFNTQLFFSKWLAEYYSQTEQYQKSQQYLSMYIDLYEGYLSDRYNPAVADLRSIIEVKQQQKEIAILERDQTIARIQMQNQRWVILSMAVLGSIILVIFVLILRQKHRQKIALQREINMHRRELSRLTELEEQDEQEQAGEEADFIDEKRVESDVEDSTNIAETIAINEKQDEQHALAKQQNNDTEQSICELRRVFHQQLVELMCLSCDYWEQSTSLSKIELAEKSKIWLVVIDEGRLRTRTMDKYLSFNKLPKKPRWRQVIRTCRFVLVECTLSTQQRDKLNDLLEDTLDTHRKLAMSSLGES